MFLNDDRSLQSIQYYIARICTTILDCLTLTNDTGDEQRNPFQWQGPSLTNIDRNRTKYGIPATFPRHRFIPLVVIGLQATVRYIEKTDFHTLEKWCPGSRHVFVHNGRLLDALYQTPTKSRPRNAGEPSAEQTYSATKRDVKAKRKHFKDGAIGVVIFSLAGAVDAVIQALEVKKVGPIFSGCRDGIIQQLQRI